jgi:hypothetical protein
MGLEVCSGYCTANQRSGTVLQHETLSSRLYMGHKLWQTKHVTVEPGAPLSVVLCVVLQKHSASHQSKCCCMCELVDRATMAAFSSYFSTLCVCPEHTMWWL